MIGILLFYTTYGFQLNNLIGTIEVLTKNLVAIAIVSKI